MKIKPRRKAVSKATERSCWQYWF